MSPRPLATRFRAGQRLSATQLNRTVDLVNDLARQPAGSVASAPFSGVPFWLEIKALGTDRPYTLTCVQPGESGNTNATEYTVFIPNIFNEETRAFPEGLTTYVYTSINERVASRGGEADETQYVTPPFLVGETILVGAFDEGRAFHSIPDGRMWAIDPPASP